MHENEISKHIVAAAIEVHKTLGGPGLLEAVYEEALVYELLDQDLKVERQKTIPITDKGHPLATPLRLDLLICDKVIVECKSVQQFSELFTRQTLTYLKLSGLKLGLIINFNQRLVTDGIRRVVNNL